MAVLTFQVVVTACLGGFMYGFAANALSGSLSQPSFQAKFLNRDDATSVQDGMLSGYVIERPVYLECLLTALVS